MVGFSYHQKQQQGKCLGLLWGSFSRSEASSEQLCTQRKARLLGKEASEARLDVCVDGWNCKSSLYLAWDGYSPFYLPSPANLHVGTHYRSPRPHGLSKMKPGCKSRRSCLEAPVLYGYLLFVLLGSEIVLRQSQSPRTLAQVQVPKQLPP